MDKIETSRNMDTYIVEEIKNYSEDMEYHEKVKCLKSEITNSFNNIENALNQLQREGNNVDGVIEELISFHKFARSQNPLRARRMYRKLYDMLNDIKDNLNEVERKKQLNKDIHTISASLGVD